jgi:phosphoglycerate dehydrogenase-like enzyme
MVIRVLALACALCALPALAADRFAELMQELELREAPVALRDTPGWSKPKKALVFVERPERLAYYAEVAPGVELIPASTSAEAADRVGDAEVLLGFCDRAAITAGKNLRWVHHRFAGVELCANAPELQSGKIMLTNMQRVGSPAIAEHVIALMFALTRGLDRYAVAQVEQKFDQRAVPLSRQWEVGGRTMLVVGLGGIGNGVARRAHALGMDVIATRNSRRDKPDYVSYVGLANELPDLMGRADVIANTAPLTEETCGLFNAALFAKMKKSAYFINIGRGAQVVQPDLIAALKEGVIAGAALDVMTPEPLPKGDPLWSAPNLLITPHVAGNADDNGERLWVVMREMLRRYVAGEKMLSVVDVKRGY